jgi:hypothetical protein
MPRHLSACFDVFLNEGVTHDDVFQLMCRELGRTDAEAVDNRMEGNYFSFSMDCNVSYDFQGRFDKFCAEVGKLSDEPFTAYCTYDTGPSLARPMSTRCGEPVRRQFLHTSRPRPSPLSRLQRKSLLPRLDSTRLESCLMSCALTTASLVLRF